jgi:hypothetical protein
MSRSISTMALLTAITLTAGCSADSGRSGGTTSTGGTAGGGGSATAGGAGTAGTGGSSAGINGATFPDCEGNNPTGDAPCAPSGFPFVRHAFPHSYSADCVLAGGTVTMSQPEHGILCLSGSTDAVQEDAVGIGLGLSVASDEPFENYRVLELFNANALGIEKVRFTVDDPPPGGIVVSADIFHSLECHGLDCVTFGFTTLERVTTSGAPTTIALAELVSAQGVAVDTRALAGLRFDVGAGEFEYCIRDLHFLDENDVEVLPAP